jgi:hypothetical protein
MTTLLASSYILFGSCFKGVLVYCDPFLTASSHIQFAVVYNQPPPPLTMQLMSYVSHENVCPQL